MSVSNFEVRSECSFDFESDGPVLSETCDALAFDFVFGERFFGDEFVQSHGNYFLSGGGSRLSSGLSTCGYSSFQWNVVTPHELDSKWAAWWTTASCCANTAQARMRNRMQPIVPAAKNARFSALSFMGVFVVL